MEFNATVPEEKDIVVEAIYSVGVPLMMGICVAAVAVNARCLAAVKWVRGPLSPTLRLSLSLSAADLHVSLLTLASFAINSLLSRVFDFSTTVRCVLLVMEALRLGAVVSVVAHLTALAFNHLLGITKPLHYPSVATPGNVRTLAVLLWVIPPGVFLVLWGPLAEEGQALRAMDHGCYQTFLSDVWWRGAFVGVALLAPLAAMCGVYTYVLCTLHRQTTAWSRSRSEGSCRSRGRILDDGQRRVSVRAVHTTLHIVGSFVVLYVPAIAAFVLVCPKGCHFTAWQGRWMWLNWAILALLVAKPLVNPLIYANRMPELRDASRRMHAAAAACFCTWRKPAVTHRRTVACRVASDASGQARVTIISNDTTAL